VFQAEGLGQETSLCRASGTATQGVGFASPWAENSQSFGLKTPALRGEGRRVSKTLPTYETQAEARISAEPHCRGKINRRWGVGAG
jgi:hypothetical protein